MEHRNPLEPKDHSSADESAPGQPPAHVREEFNWNKITRLSLEIQKSDFMRKMLSRRDDMSSKSPMGSLDCALLYSLTRWRKPSIIVETGGFLGMSSAFILKALADEGKRNFTLYSIELLEDIPQGALIPDELKSGFVPLTGRVEDFMKSGDLPETVEMFLHDSSHRYKHMLMEYRYFWKRMGDQGLLISHDVNMSAAFLRFIQKTYRHDRIGQTDIERTTHHEWGRWGNLGFAIKKTADR